MSAWDTDPVGLLKGRGPSREPRPDPPNPSRDLPAPSSSDAAAAPPPNAAAAGVRRRRRPVLREHPECEACYCESLGFADRQQDFSDEEQGAIGRLSCTQLCRWS
ncbi:hypothetical protein VPH35_082215 [Triticum aestivum]